MQNKSLLGRRLGKSTEIFVFVVKGSNAEPAQVFPPRVVHQFRQKTAIKNEVSQSKPGLSTDVLASVFGGS
ncbi:hypothetical protein F2Q68_00022136 [Brassica cretica]|uniref:Uncharacterized protein n=1 Tax=Brassica cretica TaxID=69181 RepID=A0A8S9FP31_BRACR|nr:hypothetical protein F2Q68_00022136 [Brassica cretica]